MPRLFAAAALCSTFAFLPACHHSKMHDDTHMQGEMQKVTHAICVLSATEGNTVTGYVSLEDSVIASPDHTAQAIHVAA